MKRISILLIMVALVVGMVGCDGSSTQTQYTLSVSCTVGGNVTNPGIGTFTYPAGAVVLLGATSAEGYSFVKWSGDVATIVDANSATTSIIMNGHYLITANFAYGNFIQTWYDLDDIRDDLSGYYILMNDLDSTTPGYTELASDVANQGKGWQPIGGFSELLAEESFQGIFDGQGYEISDLFMNRPYEYEIGLFGVVGEGAVIKNVGVTNADVTADTAVGSLVGFSEMGTVTNCYATGTVSGWEEFGEIVGGLVGVNMEGTVSNCYATSSVSGGGEFGSEIGGLVGANWEGTVSESYATGSVTGGELDSWRLGGLVGSNDGTITNCYATGSVTGGGEYGGEIGGLIGDNYDGTVSDSYATGNVAGGTEFSAELGGLIGRNRYGTIDNSYYNYDEVLINGENVITIGALFDADFDEWLANDRFLDINERLSIESGYYVIDSINDFKELLAFGQDNSLEFRLNNDLDLASQSDFYVPYLAGEFDGDGYTISNLNFDFDFVSNLGLFGYLAPGGEVRQLSVENVNIVGSDYIGGLVGFKNDASINDCYSTGSVTGEGSVGGLVGYSRYGTMINGYSACVVTGEYGVGGLVGVSQYGTVTDCYSTGSVTGEWSIGGLVGDNSGGTLSNCHATCSVTGGGLYSWGLGGLLGSNDGTVTNCYATGNVIGGDVVGGLVGENDDGTVSDSYATGNVTGSNTVGGLVGGNGYSIVSDSYSMGSVNGDSDVGGLVGYDDSGTVDNSFWDTETSGQATSAGGTGKTTAEMQDISTFSGATWDIIAVANPGVRNLSYIWNIVDEETYPFLSWQ